MNEGHNITWEGVCARVTCPLWLKRRVRAAMAGDADAIKHPFDHCEGLGRQQLAVVNKALQDVAEFIGGRGSLVGVHELQDGGQCQANGAAGGVEVVVGCHVLPLDEFVRYVSKYMAKAVASVEGA